MKRVFLVLIFMVVYFLFSGTHGFTSDHKLPLIQEKKTVATVNNEPITLEEFNRALASSHAARTEKKRAGPIDYSAIMTRLINTRLILLEARNIGLYELPEIKNRVDQYSRETLMELLLEQHVKDIKADENEVERLYKQKVKVWKIKSVRFEKQKDVKKIEKEIKAGHDFDDVAKKAVEEGIAKGADKGEYLKDKDLTLPIAQLVSKMEIGSVSPIVSVGKRGFIIFQLEGVRFPEEEDPEARESAKREALNQKKGRAAKEFYSDLKKRYVKINEKLLHALDYESKEPGFGQLLKDKRVIAEVRGETPLTVGELTKALKKKFYHGIERAIEGKKINKIKNQILEEMLEKRVLLKEATRQGVDRTEAYKNRVREYENSVIFGTFIKKVVTPDIKLNVEELKTHYKENIKKYTSPQMMRIKSLVFRKRTDAVEAINKLRKGTDFNWLSSHADRQVDKSTEGLLEFGGLLLTLKSLPQGVQKAVSGANPGEFRLYASPEGHFYVLYITEVISPKPRPFEDVKREISKKVFNEKVKRTIEDWADKLREYYPVKIYGTGLKE